MRPTIPIKRISAGFMLFAVMMPVSAAPLFEEDTVLDVELSGPISTLLANSPDLDELPFVLRADGTDHELKVRLRGTSRLQVCEFPPFRLNFASKTTRETVFENQDKVKLVTHCRNNDKGEQKMLLEYLAYRIFNVLSEFSYRVRLLRITYTDADNNLDPKAAHRYGFIIEPSKALAERTGASKVDLGGVTRNSLNQEQAGLVYIFQFLIGNTDWSVVTAEGDQYCCHNVDLFQLDAAPLLVPYDFDRSGLVNARYAKPDPTLRITRVRQRLYRGYCLRSNALQRALEKITDLRGEIVALPVTIPGLSLREADNARQYLEKFFERAGDHQKLLSSFESRCL